MDFYLNSIKNYVLYLGLVLFSHFSHTWCYIWMIFSSASEFTPIFFVPHESLRFSGSCLRLPPGRFHFPWATFVSRSHGSSVRSMRESIFCPWSHRAPACFHFPVGTSGVRLHRSVLRTAIKSCSRFCLSKRFSPAARARRAASPVSFLRAWRQVDLLLVLPLGLRVFLPGLLISVTAAEYSRPHRSAPSRNRPGFGSRSKSWSPRSQERALDFLSSFRSRFRCQSRSRGPVPDFAARLCPARNFSCRRAPVPWTCSLIWYVPSST
jgi:hypothetical protein